MTKTVEELRVKIASLIDGAGLYDSGVTPRGLANNILAIPEIALMIKLLDQTRDDCPECWFDEKRKVFVVTRWYTEICTTCNGTGKVSEWRPERLEVKK